tara:strand:+ start:11507 stop:12187 length:681 start_codon:yes stop_codon:yes gene_type:complete
MFSKIKILAKCHILTFIPVAYFKQNEKKILASSNSEIVIEGFWRCANHFAVFAFMNSKKNIKIAHHFHAPAQIKIAIKKNIPSLILIRDPLNSIASSLVFEPNTDPMYFIEYYKKFYLSLMKLRHKSVVSDFHETINNFDLVIKKINEKYNKNFAVFNNTEENIKEVFKAIEEENLKSMTRDVSSEIAIPSDEKEDKKKEFIKLLNDNYSKEMKKLIEIYEKFTEK